VNRSGRLPDNAEFPAETDRVRAEKFRGPNASPKKALIAHGTRDEGDAA
jgi:hypothetical protein